MHMDISQESVCIEIFRENAKRPSRGHRFVRARAIEMHMGMSLESLEPFYVVIYKNAKCPSGGHRFVRACAVEMDMDISQEPFYVEIYGRMPDASDTTSIKHRALPVTVRTPQCGHTWPHCLGH